MMFDNEAEFAKAGISTTKYAIYPSSSSQFFQRGHGIALLTSLAETERSRRISVPGHDIVTEPPTK